ncbi:MAG: glycosyl hydrolase family 88 [Thalassobius sp.]|nr:glycosyl hydrolase family 88 [Thalassovita sp.]
MKITNSLLSLIILAQLLLSCNSKQQTVSEPEEIPLSQAMADSEMKRNPNAWMIDFQPDPRWSYVNGLVCLSILDVWEKTKEQNYFDYAKGYADSLINNNGEIITYKKASYNLDNINSGKILFSLYKETGDERYKKVMDTLYHQLEEQPRTPEGGFWHKQIYPNQMWLDGIYMSAPFYAEYAVSYGSDSVFNDIAHQFELLNEHARDSKTGWYYHGWDASKSVYWADKETGLSKNFWGRGVGWYYMALVDVLDYFPAEHPKRKVILDQFIDLTNTIIKWQDEKTGLWYQVLDQGEREGNYLEATCSAMFAYGLLKGVDKGYLGDDKIPLAKLAYEGIVKNLIVKHPDGEVELIDCCAGAGLGPADNPVRDGTYEYYINEKKRSNDGKGTGPFIMASLIYENSTKFKGEKL